MPSKMIPAQAKSTIRELYRGIDGFEITRREEHTVRAAKSSPVYGEIMPTAMLRLLHALELGHHDVFYDLGCGVGKVVIAAALTTQARKCVGVELASGRAAHARKVVRAAERDGLLARKRVQIREQDIMRVSLSDASVIYTCSTAFPERFTRRLMEKVARLRQPVIFATLQVLDEHPAFSLERILRLDMSWRRRSKVYIYRVIPRSRSR